MNAVGAIIALALICISLYFIINGAITYMESQKEIDEALAEMHEAQQEQLQAQQQMREAIYGQ